MATLGADPLLTTAAVFLGAAVIAVPLFQRLKMGSVLGYLAAGAAIGPHGLAVIRDTDAVLHFAEFGVVMLLFVIGLELKPARLWRLRSDIFGLGLLQVMITGSIVAGVSVLIGLSWQVAVIIGGSLALSSTAIGIQVLRERRELKTDYGNRAFSILLLQDLAIVPLFALVAFLGPVSGPSEDPWLQAGLALGGVALLVVVIRYGLRPVFHAVAASGSGELFTAAALLVVIGSALAMDLVGLSMALGAFIAGVLLAESEFRHQLETDIEPFRGLLLGLFFMGFGMTLDWMLVVANWWIVLGGALGLYLVKGAVLYGLARLFKSSHMDALRIASVIGQGGEFAFVMITLALGVGLFEGELPAILSAIVTFSMILTPLAMALSDRVLARGGDGSLHDMKGVEHATRAKVIVAGFGRVGQVIARIMAMQDVDVTLIDNSPRRIRIARTFGTEVYFGDARRLDVLETAGAAEADLLFLCISDRDGAPESVAKLKERFPNLQIFADTYDRFSEVDMRRAGADFVVRQTYESAIALASAGLVEIGEGAFAEDIIDEFRRHDAERLDLETEHGTEKALDILRERYELSDDA